MAQWTKQKDINAINGGEEFTKGKKLSRSSLNAIVNNTLNAQDKVDNRVVNGEILTKGDKGDKGGIPSVYFQTKQTTTGKAVSVEKNGSTYTFIFPEETSGLETQKDYGSLYYITRNEGTTYEKDYLVFYENFPMERTIFTDLNGGKIEFLQYSVDIPLNSDNRPALRRNNFYLATNIDYDKYIAIPIISSNRNASICAIKNEDIEKLGIGKLHLRMRAYDDVDNLPTETGKTIYHFMVILISK